MAEETVFEKKRLTKKNLVAFLDEYATTIFKPFEGTDEERLAGFNAEWAQVNEQLKKEGRKKKSRQGKKSILKVKWGLRLGYRGKLTESRLKLIAHIKNTFDL